MGEWINAAGIEGSVGVNRVSQAQTMGLDTQAEAERVAGESNVAAVGLHHTPNPLPVVGGQNIGARLLQMGSVDSDDIVAVMSLQTDDLYRRLPKGTFNPVTGLGLLVQ